MSAQPLDNRLAHLESSVEHLNGAYEQIDKRLGHLRVDLTAGFARVDLRLDALDRKIDGKVEGLDSKIDSVADRLDGKIDRNFRTLIGWMIGQTAVIVGAIAAVAFAVHR